MKKFKDFGVGISYKLKAIFFNFGEPTTHLGLDVEQTKKLITVLKTQVDKLEKNLQKETN